MPNKTKPFIKADHDVLFNNDLKPLSRLILVSLKYWDRNTGRGCFARKEVIANMMGISLHQLRRGLKELADKNFIHIDRHGQGKPDTIWIIENEDVDTKNIQSCSHSLYNNKRLNDKAGLSSEDVDKSTEDDIRPSVEDDIPIDLKATEACHKRLQEAVGIIKWDIWFRDCYVAEERNNQVKVYTPSNLTTDFVSKHYKAILHASVGNNVVIETKQKEFVGNVGAR